MALQHVHEVHNDGLLDRMCAPGSPYDDLVVLWWLFFVFLGITE
jgi:hypothetical protein